MKKSVASILITGAALCLALSACKDKEESSVPDLKVPAKTQAAAQDSEPALQSMQSLAPAKTAGGTAAAPVSDAGVVPPGDNGSYVIQVGLKPSKSGANAIVKQLAQNNISAYTVEVTNPGELEGSYYRVRVGYFRTPAAAMAYAQSVISKLGISGWWVDDKANDAVSGPYENDSEESAGSYSNSNSNSGINSTASTANTNANNSGYQNAGGTSSGSTGYYDASSASGYSYDAPASSAAVAVESSSSFEESSSSAASAPVVETPAPAPAAEPAAAPAPEAPAPTAAPAASTSDNNSYDDWE